MSPWSMENSMNHQLEPGRPWRAMKAEGISNWISDPCDDEGDRIPLVVRTSIIGYLLNGINKNHSLTIWNYVRGHEGHHRLSSEEEEEKVVVTTNFLPIWSTSSASSGSPLVLLGVLDFIKGRGAVKHMGSIKEIKVGNLWRVASALLCENWVLCCRERRRVPFSER